MQRLAILVPIYNGLEYSRKCLKNLDESITLAGFEADQIFIVVVDDGSTDGSSNWIKTNYPKVIVLSGDGNLWWSGSINKGAAYAVNNLDTDFVLLWNNDIMALKNYFFEISQLIKENNQDIVYGSKIYSNYEKLIIWSMGGIFNSKNGNFYMMGYNQTDSGAFDTDRLADWLPGMGTLIPRKVILNSGYWDHIHFPHYHSDTEYTYRASLNGFTIIVSPRLCLLNDTSNSGHKEINNLKQLIRSFSDRKSLYNIKVNLSFFNMYATSKLAYSYLFKMYFKYVGGFFKWKVLQLFGRKRPNHA